MSGVPGMPLPGWAPELKPCGTLAAYRRHLRRGEPVDRACAQAVTRAWHDRVTAGWRRPPRAYRRRVHLAGIRGPLCGRGRSTSAVTDDPAGVTCGHCSALLSGAARDVLRRVAGRSRAA